MGTILFVVLSTIVLSGAFTEESKMVSTTMLETVDAALAEEKQIEKRSVSHFCNVNGHHYSDGHVFFFNIPCVKHRCEKGVVKMFEEGCLYPQNKSCHPVDSDLEIDCLTYRCSKIKINDVYRYSLNLFAARCKDHHGRCREYGEVFQYTIHGRLYSTCVCYPVSEQERQYDCIGG